MLDVDMDMEADLGIDSIKKVEIFSSLGGDDIDHSDQPSDEAVEFLEGMATKKTIREIVDYFEAAQTNLEKLGAESAENSKPAASSASSNTSASASFDKKAFLNKFISVVSEKTGYPVEMLDETMDMEADLGIDSIKKVEIFSALAEGLPASITDASEEDEGAVEFIEGFAQQKSIKDVADYLEAYLGSEKTEAASENTQATEIPELNVEEFMQNLLSIISEKTGYPKEMLDEDMDMEADLGIDSIKKVEIFVALGSDLPEEMMEETDASHSFVEELAKKKTIREIVEHIVSYRNAPQASEELSSEDEKIKEVFSN